jgi:hypothetical protein
MWRVERKIPIFARNGTLVGESDVGIFSIKYFFHILDNTSQGE